MAAKLSAGPSCLYQDYSGAFCALACLRSSLMQTAISLRSGRLERAQRALAESRYWVEQVIVRRAVARRHHGYVPPLPDMPDEPTRRKGAR